MIKATHYIGKSGKLYPKDGDVKYLNHGLGGVYRGFMDLPKEDYPYTFKFYSEEFTVNKKYTSKPLIGEHTFETCGSIDNPHMNGIVIKGTHDEAKIKLQELRKKDNTIGLKII